MNITQAVAKPFVLNSVLNLGSQNFSRMSDGSLRDIPCDGLDSTDILRDTCFVLMFFFEVCFQAKDLCVCCSMFYVQIKNMQNYIIAYSDLSLYMMYMYVSIGVHVGIPAKQFMPFITAYELHAHTQTYYIDITCIYTLHCISFTDVLVRENYVGAVQSNYTILDWLSSTWPTFRRQVFTSLLTTRGGCFSAMFDRQHEPNILRQMLNKYTKNIL